MIKFYSQTHLRFSLTKCLRSTFNVPPIASKLLAHHNYSRFSTDNKQDNAKEFEDYTITDEELYSSRYTQQKTFRERNRTTFYLLGSGIACKFLGFPLITTALFWASFVSLFRAERYFLKLRKLYEDVYGVNTQNLLAETMLKNDEIRHYIKKDTLCFTNMMLARKSHAENRIFQHNSYEAVQRRYHYSVLFFDISTGAEGSIASQCVYNYDKDYYFRLIYIRMIKPETKVVKVEDNRNMINIEADDEGSVEK